MHRTLLVFVLAIIFSGCSNRIDSKFIGTYLDENDPTGIFNLDPHQTGECWSVESISAKTTRSSNSPEGAFGTCEMDGIMVKMTITQTTDNLGYPEFRGKTAILTVDGDTLITQTGRRFVKERSMIKTQTTDSKTTQPSNSSLTMEKAQKSS